MYKLLKINTQKIQSTMQERIQDVQMQKIYT